MICLCCCHHLFHKDDFMFSFLPIIVIVSYCCVTTHFIYYIIYYRCHQYSSFSIHFTLHSVNLGGSSGHSSSALFSINRLKSVTFFSLDTIILDIFEFKIPPCTGVTPLYNPTPSSPAATRQSATHIQFVFGYKMIHQVSRHLQAHQEKLIVFVVLQERGHNLSLSSRSHQPRRLSNDYFRQVLLCEQFLIIPGV